MFPEMTFAGIPNEDNDALGYITGRGFSIGLTDEVNGAGAEPMPDFIATRHELTELARYWARELLETEYSDFVTRSVGSDTMRLRSFACRRLDRIADLLDVGVTECIWDNAKARVGLEKDPQTWRAFLLENYPAEGSTCPS